jgi:hypothetical protein
MEALLIKVLASILKCSKKGLARNRVRASPEASMFSDRLSNGSSDDSDGAGNSGARCSRDARCNSRSTDKVGSTGTGNSRIHTKDNSDTHSSDNRTRFPLTPARQNAAQVRKQIRMPSMQLTGPFSL